MPTQPLIVGNPVLVVVDIQQGGSMPVEDVGIPHMSGHAERVERAEKLVAAARSAGVPVVFFQEVHRPSGVDFGRELDGTEGVLVDLNTKQYFQLNATASLIWRGVARGATADAIAQEMAAEYDVTIDHARRSVEATRWQRALGSSTFAAAICSSSGR